MSFGNALAQHEARIMLAFFAPLLATVAIVSMAAGWWIAQQKPQTFDAWFIEHQKTCSECGGPPDHPMCVEAFKRMQEALRK